MSKAEARADLLQQVRRVAIHPGIGIARVGDSCQYFYGPETCSLPTHKTYRDQIGAVLRQGARFRLYGLAEDGVTVLCELTAAEADIEWRVHLCNRKAAWYHFISPLDLEEAADLACERRNPTVEGDDRKRLVIDAGRVSLHAPVRTEEGVAMVGQFLGNQVVLGEAFTDGEGRLVILGGTGMASSPNGQPILDRADPHTYCNAAGWYDTTSDGPVSATVTIAGRQVPVDDAWVVVAPPNYAPGIVGWCTLYDVLEDLYVRSGWMNLPERPSFDLHIRPILQRLSGLQWVNHGFLAMFGWNGAMNFEDPKLMARLGAAPVGPHDPHKGLRRIIYTAFRRPTDRPTDPRAWPWLYGDRFGDSVETPSGRLEHHGLALPSTWNALLRSWVEGKFEGADPSGPAEEPLSIESVPLQAQPRMLDRAALHHCLGGAFRPGYELTWPMRHLSLYRAPFRIRGGEPFPTDPGPRLTRAKALAPDGPLHRQAPGDLTRWLALPWQSTLTDCGGGYDQDFHPRIPTFWPARVPNNVLAQADFDVASNSSLDDETRFAAFQTREKWSRVIEDTEENPVEAQMVVVWPQQGILTPLVVADGRRPVWMPPLVHVQSLPGAMQSRAGSIQSKAAVSASELDGAAPSQQQQP